MISLYHRFFSSRLALAGLVVAAVAGVSAPQAYAGTTLPPAPCSTPIQPFLTWGDQNSYCLMPGETVGNFAGSAWKLSGGAKIVTTAIYGGVTASVLDLPAGSTAVSPSTPIQVTDPTARTMIRNVKGTGAVNAAVTVGTLVESVGSFTGTSAWGPSNILALGQSGFYPFTLTGPASGDIQIYNFAIDPYNKG
jgi:hypothetical protein